MSEAPVSYAREERRASDLDLVPRMVCTADEMKARLVELQKFVKEVMDEGVDYGPPFPGSTKSVLLKPGAEKLAEIYGYTVEPHVTERLEQWGPPLGPFFHYEVEAKVYSKRSGMLIGKGLGSCNTKENRYRWRIGGRVCPKCNKEGTIIKGKPEYERDPAFKGGWLCYGKKGGCGEKWKKGDAAIEDQEVGKVENEDIHTLVNTVLKIAVKRAYVAAVISVTQSSGLFTGEDEDDEIEEAGAAEKKRTGADKGGGPRRSNGPGSHATDSGAGKTPDDKHPVEVMIRGQKYFTAGVTAMKLLQVWDLTRAFDSAKGKDAHKALMQETVGVGSSVDLSEDMADRVLEAMRTVLDGGAGDHATSTDGKVPY